MPARGMKCEFLVGNTGVQKRAFPRIRVEVDLFAVGADRIRDLQPV